MMGGVVLLLSAGAVVSALLGGMLALRVTRWVGYVIAVGAGIRIGAAFFDLLPEAVRLLYPNLELAMLAAAFGFLAFYVIEKMTLLHVGHETAAELDHEDAAHHHVGLVGAAGMSIHSILDGVALGAALQAGPDIAFVIAIVVILHRFSDGIGIVSLLLANRVRRQAAYRWVGLSAAAPVLGIVVTAYVTIPDAVLGVMLATFAGFFLYIGAAELLPEAHRSDRSRLVILATLAGAVGIVVLSRSLGVSL